MICYSTYKRVDVFVNQWRRRNRRMNYARPRFIAPAV